jgi:ribose transport system substrate-binding protein
MRPRLLVVLALLAFLALLAACGGDDAAAPAEPAPAEPGQGGTIALSFPFADQPVVARIIDFATDQAEVRGYEFIVDDPGADLNRQIGTIETWIDSGDIAAIVSVVPEPEVFTDAARQAKEAGIPWVTYASTIPDEVAFLGIPHYTSTILCGQTAAKWINDNLNGQADVGLITWTAAEWGRDRTQGLKDGLADAAGATIVAEQEALASDEATQIVETFLQANPDMKVVVAVTEAGAEGAYQAFINSGADPMDSEIFVCGSDGTQRAYELIKDGTFYRASAALSMEEIGRAVIDVPADVLEGGAGEDFEFTPVLVTTEDQEELDTLLAEWEE